MPLPTLNDVHFSSLLTNVAVAYIQDQKEYVADKVFPMCPVPKASGNYLTLPADAWFRDEARTRAPGTESAGGGFAVDLTATYSCLPFAWHQDISDLIRAEAVEPLNLDQIAVEFIMQKLLLQKEVAFAAKFFTTGVWTGSTTGTDIVAQTKWDAANSTPIKDIRAQISRVKEKTGFRPNFALASESVKNALLDNADIIGRMQTTQTKIANTSLLAELLELGNFYTMSGIKNTAAEGAAKSTSFIGGNYFMVGYAAPSPSIMAPSAGYVFTNTGYLGNSPSGIRMGKFRLEQLKSDRVEGETYYDQKLVAADLGAFWSTVLT